MSSYRQALAALYDRTAGGTRLGLERTAALLRAMGDPQNLFASIHVAGTNGKGSVVATAAAVLRSDGQRVGAYTSPHLVDFRERIVVNGVPIPEDAVTEFAERWLPECDRLGATFFEATTALAFDHFARAGVTIAVVETGLGGRLDSTNVLLPLAAGVTSVATDHTDLLGETVAEIAAEKAGIFKAGRPVVIGEQEAALARLLRDHATAARVSRVHLVRDESIVEDVQCDRSGTTWNVRNGVWTGELHTGLIGYHQAHNTMTALALVHAGGIHPPDVRAALRPVRLAGRFDIRGNVIFDVAHNRSAAAVLAGTLAHLRPERPLIGLVGVLGDKDWRGVLAEVAPALDRIVCTTPPSAPADRRWDAGAAALFAGGLGVPAEAVPDFDAALRVALDGGGTVLVTGSFHTVGDAMCRLQVNPLAT